MRFRTAAEVEPRRPRGSSSVDESEEELGGRLARADAAFLGQGALGAALPLGRPRGRFTGTFCSGSGCVSLFGGSTDGVGANGADGGGSSASDFSSSALVFSVRAFIGSRITSICLNNLFNHETTGSGAKKSSNDKWDPCRGTISPNESRIATSICVNVRPPTGM